jgi:hypothetical protein
MGPDSPRRSDAWHRLGCVGRRNHDTSSMESAGVRPESPNRASGDPLVGSARYMLVVGPEPIVLGELDAGTLPRLAVQLDRRLTGTVGSRTLDVAVPCCDRSVQRHRSVLGPPKRVTHQKTRTPSLIITIRQDLWWKKTNSRDSPSAVCRRHCRNARQRFRLWRRAPDPTRAMKASSTQLAWPCQQEPRNDWPT